VIGYVSVTTQTLSALLASVLGSNELNWGSLNKLKKYELCVEIYWCRKYCL